MIPMQLATIASGDIFKLTRDSNQDFNFTDIMRGEGNNRNKIKVDGTWLDSGTTVFLIENLKEN